MMNVVMLIQKTTKMRKISSTFVATAVIALFSAGIMAPHFVAADRFDEQIKQLSQANEKKNQNLAQLGTEATSLSDKIAKLQAQVNELEKQIQANKDKIAKLQKEIEAAQKELDKEKKLLGENIRAMYLEGQISTLEMLASSKDLSDFVDKEQYRDTVKTKIKNTLDKVTVLKAQLKASKEKVEGALKDQQAIQAQLTSQRAEQSRLLSLNQSQQSELDSQIKNNNAKIAELRAQQAAENAKLFGGANVVLGAACDTSHGDTYPSPWCSSPQDSMVDSWGMYNRECVSYTAWKVAESGRRMPYWGGIGNANQWPGNAQAAGIPTDSNPKAGDVAISMRGFYGHAMYVEGVNGDGTINISQYNQQLNGTFSRAYNVSPAGLIFIHFQ